jgi:hypothetical protein
MKVVFIFNWLWLTVYGLIMLLLVIINVITAKPPFLVEAGFKLGEQGVFSINDQELIQEQKLSL